MQVPRPSQVAFVIWRFPVQLEGLHSTSRAYFEQPPKPSQSPVCPQLVRPASLQTLCGSGLSASSGQHVPSRPVRLHETQGPWQATLQQVIDYKDKGCFPDGVEGAGFPELTNAITSGSSLGIFAPSGAVVDSKAAAPTQEFGAYVLPAATVADTRSILSTTNGLAVNAGSPNQEAALKLLEFFTEPTSQDLFAKSSGNVSLAATSSTGVPADLAGLGDFLTDESKHVPLPNLFWPNGGVYDALGTGVQGLLTGQATPEVVLEAMDAAETTQAFIAADTEFHGIIVAASGNSTLASLIQNLSGGTLRARIWRSVIEQDAIEVTKRRHWDIYSALRDGDAERARAADLIHLSEGVRWLENCVRSAEAGAAWIDFK